MLAALCLCLCCLSCEVASQGHEAALSRYLDAAAAYDTGDMAKALSIAESALALDRTMVPALVLAGKAAFFQSIPDKASSFLEQALRLRPSGTEARLWLARVQRFNSEDDKARSLCESVLSDDGSNLAALRLLARLASDGDEIDRSLALLNRAVEASSEAGLIFLDRASLRWAMGDREGCTQDLKAALAVLPDGSAYWQSAMRLLNVVEGSGP